METRGRSVELLRASFASSWLALGPEALIRGYAKDTSRKPFSVARVWWSKCPFFSNASRIIVPGCASFKHGPSMHRVGRAFQALGCLPRYFRQEDSGGLRGCWGYHLGKFFLLGVKQPMIARITVANYGSSDFYSGGGGILTRGAGVLPVSTDLPASVQLHAILGGTSTLPVFSPAILHAGSRRPCRNSLSSRL